MSEIDRPPISTFENILRAMIDGTEYDKPPRSREEELLLELKEVIEAGGGGGTCEVLSVRGLEDDEPKKGHVLLIIQDLVKLGVGISYNAETNTISVNQQSIETTVADTIEDSKADESDIDDLFNN